MSPADLMRYGALVALVDAYIARSLAEDPHCKPYEGTWTLSAPSYFERTTAPDTPWLTPRLGWTITLACYLIGPARGYEWHGSTLAEALDAAFADVERWIAEAAE